MIKTGDVRCTCGSNNVTEVGCDLDKIRYHCHECGRNWWTRSQPENDQNATTPER